MHDNSEQLFVKYALGHFPANARVLEIGAQLDDSAYRHIVGVDTITWETLDIAAGPGVTHMARSEYDYPVPDACYDVVLSGQVFEHVRKPWLWVKELSRIVKPGGVIIIVAPVSWPYHAAPVDCWRAYPEGMKALCEDAHLEVVLSQCESLEAARYRRTWPGRGRMRASQPSVSRYSILRILSWFGYAVEVAYDTITIARRPAGLVTS